MDTSHAQVDDDTDNPALRNPALQKLLDILPHRDRDRGNYDDNSVRKVIEECPECVMTRYRFQTESRFSVSCRYPLYKAVSLGASLAVVRRMYDAYPTAIMEGGTMNKTPLHAACSHPETPVEVVAFLIEKYPQGVSRTTRYGYTPLHNACEYGCHPKIIKMLVEQYPAALHMRNKLGETPYMTAKRAQAAPLVLSLTATYNTEDGGHDIIKALTDQPLFKMLRMKSDRSSIATICMEESENDEVDTAQL